MAKNNICKSLIVYGSWQPGGKNHSLVEHLPGEWQKGRMLVGAGSDGDDIYPGEDRLIDAWILKFSDCSAELFSPEWEEEKKMLFERWENLDKSMGAGLERDQRSWWPTGQEPISGANGQLVVNIYLPVKNFTHLKQVTDSPHPDDEYDLKKLWKQQLDGEKEYDEYEFIALIKDARLEECIALFKGLPGIEPFIDKLTALYQDMAYETGYLLKQETDGFYLYAFPKPEQEITAREAEDLVKKDLKQKSAILEENGESDKADALRNVQVQVASFPEGEQEYEGAFEALDEVNELIDDSKQLNEHWEYCLAEACYGIAANEILSNYLMASWHEIAYNFDIPYRLWLGGWSYNIYGSTVFIFKG
jgi:hypothetical protein